MIAGEIRRFLRDDGMIRVSRSMKELGLRVRRARETLTAKSGREPGLSEIAKELDISCEEVEACMGAGAEVESCTGRPETARRAACVSWTGSRTERRTKNSS